MTRLAKNFYLSEFLRSQTAERMGRPIKADQRVIGNLKHLAEDVLQPIRDELNAEYGGDVRIHITSGYRPEWLNKAIGGSRTSAHMCGDKSGLAEAAADFVVSGVDASLFDICKLIVAANGENPIPFDQLIYEGTWVHVGWRDKPRGEVLTAKFEPAWRGGRAVYHRGLVA